MGVAKRVGSEGTDGNWGKRRRCASGTSADVARGNGRSGGSADPDMQNIGQVSDLAPPVESNVTEEWYEAALEEIEGLWKAEAGGAEEARLEALVDQVMYYEGLHYPMG